MNRQELTPYHRDLVELLNSEPDRSERKEFLKDERTTERYKLAKEHVGTRVSSLIKPILPAEKAWELPISDEGRTEKLVDTVISSIFEELPGQKDVDFLAREALSEYNDLPKRTKAEIKKANEVVTKAALGLLQNPQNINIAEKTWTAIENEQNDIQDSKEPFSKKVKEKMLKIIDDDRENITAEQLAGLVKVYSNKDESQASAKKTAENLLRRYFNERVSRSQRTRIIISLYQVFFLI